MSSGVPGCDDAPAATTTFWAEIDDVIGAFDDVEVVLDDDHALAVIDETAEHLQQAGDVFGVQAGGWFVEDVEGFAGRTLGSSVASLTRCASPPESVVAGWPSLM